MNGLFTHPRALSIDGPALSGLDATFTPTRLRGTEGINQLFDYRLTLQTSDRAAANLDLDSVIGKEITCLIELEGSGSGSHRNLGAGTREISALVTAARFITTDNRHTVVEFTLRPWLHLATLTADCKVFQNQTAVQTILAVLSDYPFVVDKRLIETYPQRDYSVQYNETDYAFVTRLMQEWGINYHFEHSKGVHRLILSDYNGAFPEASPACATIPCYPPGYKIDCDYIHAFSPEHKLTVGTVASRDYDYTRSRATMDASYSDPRPTGQNRQELYYWRDADRGTNYSQPNAGCDGQANQTNEQGRQLARLRLQEQRQHGQRARGSAYLRGLPAATSFTLSEHPHRAANVTYLVLTTDFLLENVGEESQARSRTESQIERGVWKVQTDFTAQPINAVLRPDLTQAKPRSLGPEVAMVTGPDKNTAANNLYTDQYGRIKVQFPWDRYGKGNQNSSCWVRVALPWAGNQQGQQAIPRTGQEVFIKFLGGDPDQPICCGSLHNQMNMPPWQLPAQQALTGLRSRELNDEGGGNASSGRSNHLILDDSKDAIQVQLKSDHDHSQLSLGMITRIEDNQGRTDLRGQGFELRTDGHGALHAKNGLLVSTEARVRAESHITSLDETAQRFSKAHQQHDTLANAAQQAGAQEQSDQAQVARDLQRQNNEIAGNGNANLKSGQFPELTAPHVVVASPAGIASTTAGSTQQHSAQHHAITAEQHISLSSGNSVLASVRDAIRLFACKAGLKLVAAAGDIDIKALQQSINVVAKLNMSGTAETITVNASKAVVVNGGGSYTRWTTAGIEQGTNGDHIVHAAAHRIREPKCMPAHSATEITPYNEMFVLREQNGRPVSNFAYAIQTPSGEIVSGRTDSKGLAVRTGTGNQTEDLHLKPERR
ncbi:type VI secretion system secreted protein VgrG [Oxalobacteraceae bacterium GrIS 2.11]